MTGRAFLWFMLISLLSRVPRRTFALASKKVAARLVHEKTSISMKSSSIEFHHLEVVNSTQDEAKRILREREENSPLVNYRVFAVTTEQQDKGRGTSGRDWIGKRGNMFLTVGIPAGQIPTRLWTMLPLQVGVVLARHAHHVLSAWKEEQQITGQCHTQEETLPKVTVKWPNDVLIDDKKLAGVLIENEVTQQKQSWFLIGIGVNVAHAPAIDESGKNSGRPSTCLFDVVKGKKETSDGTEEARNFAIHVATELIEWIDNQETMNAPNVISEWKKWAEFGRALQLRDVPGNEVVVPVGIETDGQLRVVGENGEERLLVSDYMR